jgi:hypothetical protein
VEAASEVSEGRASQRGWCKKGPTVQGDEWKWVGVASVMSRVQALQDDEEAQLARERDAESTG